MEKLSLKLNLAFRPIKGCSLLWLTLIVLMSSCGFQHRRYTTGWHWDGASPVASHFAPIEKPSLIQCEEKVTPEDHTPILAICKEIHPEDSIFSEKKQPKVDTLFPITHQPLVYWEGEQWNVLDETIIDHQLEEARSEAWLWIIEILFFGLILFLDNALSLQVGWGFDALARSIELNNDIKRKLKTAQPHPLLKYWMSYLQWTSIILWIPLILLGLLLLVPTILYIYGQ
jgi:hypothetical protein